MKYFSEKTKKFYPSESECVAAEAEFDAKMAKIAEEKKKLAEARKERAKEVEDAYKEMQVLIKAAREGEKRFIELRNKFVKDYGSFHMTVSNPEAVPSVVNDLNDLLNMLFF
jgi:SMC interacting uncharacterized protein involved in chromosome segregation